MKYTLLDEVDGRFGELHFVAPDLRVKVASGQIESNKTSNQNYR
jgi:hypothetical protein